MVIKLPHLLNQIFVHRPFDQRHLEIPISHVEFSVEFLEHRNNCPPILNYEGFTTWEFTRSDVNYHTEILSADYVSEQTHALGVPDKSGGRCPVDLSDYSGVGLVHKRFVLYVQVAWGVETQNYAK